MREKVSLISLKNVLDNLEPGNEILSLFHRA